MHRSDLCRARCRAICRARSLLPHCSCVQCPVHSAQCTVHRGSRGGILGLSRVSRHAGIINIDHCSRSKVGHVRSIWPTGRGREDVFRSKTDGSHKSKYMYYRSPASNAPGEGGVHAVLGSPGLPYGVQPSTSKAGSRTPSTTIYSLRYRLRSSMSTAALDHGRKSPVDMGSQFNIPASTTDQTNPPRLSTLPLPLPFRLSHTTPHRRSLIVVDVVTQSINNCFFL